MKPKSPPPPDAADLRRHAEDRLRERRPETDPNQIEADTQRLVHELQVHQFELEMQNEELQKTRDELESQLEKYSDLYDFAPVGFMTLDREGTIREANLTSASLLGIERFRMVKRRFEHFLSAADQSAFNAFLTRVFEGKARESCEATLLKDLKPAADVRIEAAVAAGGRECRVVIEDITRHKRAEAERLILNKLESTGILAGGLAHDFNNLLAIIVLNLDVARGTMPSGREWERPLQEAKKAALTARGLTQQLIAFAKGGASTRKLSRLAGLIQESVNPALSGSRVRCEFALPDDLWLAELDAGQIGQVIRNVVLNAREAMPQGGVISVRAENVVLGPHENSTLPSGDYVRVSIADRGVGMTKEVLPKIFDPYFSTKQRGDQKGMGLGLTICHTVVRRHGGAIAVESEAGVGSIFHILLPASRKTLGEEKASVPKVISRPGRILVMDDEEFIRKLVGVLLERMGHEVELVEDGQSAVEAYGRAIGQGRPFDAVVLDLTVRGAMGGREALQALRAMDPGVKAMVMSGYDDDPVVLEPERYGFKGGLAKPFDNDCLREVLARVMGSQSNHAATP